MQFDWKPEYDELVTKLLQQHFGDAQNLTLLFPCIRNDYRWGKHRPAVVDSRIPAKNNTEYHGLERHAIQYHITGQYEYAYHHWLLAAAWRREDMNANNFDDDGHKAAIEYTIKQALYNLTLHQWQQKGGILDIPRPDQFDLDESKLDIKEKDAEKEMERLIDKTRNI